MPPFKDNELLEYIVRCMSDKHIGTENIVDDIIGFTKNTIPRFLKFRLGLNTVVNLPSSRQTLYAYGKIQKLTGLEAENFTVFIPDGTTGNFPAYLSTLTNVYFSLMGTAAHDKQSGNDGGSPLLLVINDLLVWSARVSSTPEFINQSWNLPNASKLLDPAKGVSELKKYYNPSLRGGPGICKLSVAYPKLVDSLKSVDDTFTSVATKLNEDLMYDWTKKLNELSVSLDRAIVTLQKYNHGSAGTDNLVSKTAVKALQEKTNQINQFIYQTAQCIELLSVVLYQLKVCSECYFKTVTKINDSL